MSGLNDVYLLYRQTGTGCNLGPIGDATQERYSRGTGVNQQNYPWNTKVRLTLRDTAVGGGGTATFQVQTAPDANTWSTLWTVTLLLAAGQYLVAQSKLVKMPLVAGVWNKFLRVNVSAISGGTTPTVDAYATIRGYGI